MLRLVIILLLLTATVANGQSLTKEFFTMDGKLCKESESFYFLVGKKIKIYDLLRMDTIDSYVDTVRTYYSGSNSKRSTALYNADGYLQGNFIMYHKNGRLKEKGLYFEDKRVGYFMSWYSNGKPFQTLQYFEKNKELKDYPFDYKILNYFDSLGNQRVANGQGVCDCYLSEEKLREHGKVVGGLRDSVWQGFSGDTLVFVESYEKGKFLNGTRYFNGKEYLYSEFETQPEYKHGMESLYGVIARNMKYPVSARRMNIEGNIMVEFIVGREGTISEVKIQRGIQRDCDQEALRVVKLLKEWIPAKVRGKPVTTKFVMPIKFRLD